MSPTSPMPEREGRWSNAAGASSNAFLASVVVAVGLQVSAFQPLPFILSLLGPSMAAIVFLLLLAVVPSLAGEDDDPTVCATLALVFTLVHLCMHTALTGNPVGLFSRLQFLPGEPWQGSLSWILSMVAVTMANLWALWARHKRARK